MKKFLVLLSFCAIVLSSSLVKADDAPLGLASLAVKIDQVQFTNSTLNDADIKDGAYVGVEAYLNLKENLYIGGEVGHAKAEGTMATTSGPRDTEASYTNLELNLKYLVEGESNFLIDFGAGLAYIRGEEELKSTTWAASSTRDDWMMGGQVFADFNYTFSSFFAGANIKYQITEDSDETSYDYTNYRYGVQFGIMF